MSKKLADSDCSYKYRFARLGFPSFSSRSNIETKFRYHNGKIRGIRPIRKTTACVRYPFADPVYVECIETNDKGLQKSRLFHLNRRQTHVSFWFYDN